MANQLSDSVLIFHVIHERDINPVRPASVCGVPGTILADFVSPIVDYGVFDLVHLYVLAAFHPQISHKVTHKIFSQPRPFWQEGSGILMDSWTCYT